MKRGLVLQCNGGLAFHTGPEGPSCKRASSANIYTCCTTPIHPRVIVQLQAHESRLPSLPHRVASTIRISDIRAVWAATNRSSTKPRTQDHRLGIKLIRGPGTPPLRDVPTPSFSLLGSVSLSEWSGIVAALVLQQERTGCQSCPSLSRVSSMSSKRLRSRFRRCQALHALPADTTPCWMIGWAF